MQDAPVEVVVSGGLVEPANDDTRAYVAPPWPYAITHQPFWQALGHPTTWTLSLRWLPEETTFLNEMWLHHILK